MPPTTFVQRRLKCVANPDPVSKILYEVFNSESGFPVFSECPQFWEEWEGHCYLFSPQDSWYTWSRAQAACRAHNSSSDLPSVTSEREEMFIRNNTLGSTFWLGGYRLNTIILQHQMFQFNKI